MSNEKKEELSCRLNEMIVQLQQAVKYLRKDDFVGASIFVGNVQDQLPMTRQRLMRG